VNSLITNKLTKGHPQLPNIKRTNKTPLELPNIKGNNKMPP